MLETIVKDIRLKRLDLLRQGVSEVLQEQE